MDRCPACSPSRRRDRLRYEKGVDLRPQQKGDDPESLRTTSDEMADDDNGIRKDMEITSNSKRFASGQQKKAAKYLGSEQQGR
ncbi:MAG: hypothetical protein L6R42_006801 [Xanthoria sp. 1 TBL-2021]|nr:MAG: hypothetical protein L6R42_006801 [Xanthoria sp. 1 TBL-2021]